MRLTWKRGPLSIAWYEPQGRCTFKCSSVTAGATFFNCCTSRRKPSPFSRRATKTASAVETTTRFSTPNSATKCLSLITWQPCESTNTTEPCAKLSSLSRSDNSQTACHEPTSDQPYETGITAARL